MRARAYRSRQRKTGPCSGSYLPKSRVLIEQILLELCPITGEFSSQSYQKTI